MSASDDRQFKTAAKKAYSEINRALLSMQVDGLYWDNTSGTANERSIRMRDRFGEFLQFTTTSDNASVFGSTVYKNYKTAGGAAFTATTDWSSASSVDGMFYRFVDPTTSGCDGSFTLGGVNFTDYCGQLTVDTNGIKPPNTMGKDVVALWIFERQGGVYYTQPAGAMDSNSNCKASCTTNAEGFCGQSCTYNLMTDAPLP